MVNARGRCRLLRGEICFRGSTTVRLKNPNLGIGHAPSDQSRGSRTDTGARRGRRRVPKARKRGPERAVTTLLVDNQSSFEMTIYVLRRAERVRPDLDRDPRERGRRHAAYWLLLTVSSWVGAVGMMGET